MAILSVLSLNLCLECHFFHVSEILAAFLKTKQPNKKIPKPQTHEAQQKSNKESFILCAQGITATILRYHLKPPTDFNYTIPKKQFSIIVSTADLF